MEGEEDIANTVLSELEADYENTISALPAERLIEPIARTPAGYEDMHALQEDEESDFTGEFPVEFSNNDRLPIDSRRADQITDIMSSFAPPKTPEWASSVDEDAWVGKLLEKVQQSYLQDSQ